jgi:hypothetical protein
MADEDWAAVRIPILMAKAIDQLLKQDIMKKNGIFSRSDLATRVIGTWFANFEKEFGMFVPSNVARNLKGYDTMKALDKEQTKNITDSSREVNLTSTPKNPETKVDSVTRLVDIMTKHSQEKGCKHTFGEIMNEWYPQRGKNVG